VRKLLVALVAVAICSVGYAADKGGGKAGGGGATVGMNPKTDPVLIRLALTDDQAKAIDKINADADAKKGDYKGAKIKDLQDETRKKIREVLTAAQQPKFDDGLKIMADFDAKVAAARKEMAAAVKADATKKDDAKKACDDKIAAATTERDKALDDKVGKVAGK
jgi:hypothetical protein